MALETGFLSRRPRSWRHERPLRRRKPCPHEKNPVSERLAEQLPVLACELLQACWQSFPDVALTLDRHFTAPRHIAVVDTTIHRHWPTEGVLLINHVNSERSPLVQLADFVAGSVYEWHKAGNPTVHLIQNKIRTAITDDWSQIKARWIQAS